MSSTMEQELLGAAESEAGFPTNPGPNEAALDVSLLGGQLLSFGDLEIPIDQFADFGQLGALSSISEASSPLDGHAASGLLGPDGGLSLDSAEADWGTTTIDLLSFSDALGLGGLSGLAVDELDLELGAMGSEVIAEDGVFLDPDGGGTGPGQYIAGDASLFAHSPLIEDAAAQISDLGGQVDTTIEDLTAQTFDTDALDAALGNGSVSAPECSVDSNMQGDIVDAVVGAPITSADQLVTIDFATGSVEIHLEHLVDGSDPWAGGDDAGLNGLAPNTELIDESTYPLVAEGVEEIMEEATALMSAAVAASVHAVTVTCEWSQQGPLPGDVIDVDWGPISLGDGAAGNFPPAETDCSGPTAPALCSTLANSIDSAGPQVAAIFSTVYDFLISDEGTAVYELLITDILTGLVTQTIDEGLAPVFTGLTDLLSLQVNHQEMATCTTSDGTEVLASVEVSALSLLLTGVEGRVGLGNSGVRVDACAVAEIVPVLEVDPSEVFPGDALEIVGSGYTPDSTVAVELFDADGNLVGGAVVVNSDEAGSFALPAIVQMDTLPGEYTVIGTDNATGTPAQAPLTVLTAITPSITADPSEVAEGGATTTVTGADFTPDGMVTLHLADAEGNVLGEPVTVPAGADGTFEAVLDVPADAAVGDGYTIVAVDEETGQEATTPLAIVEGPEDPGPVDPGPVDPGPVDPGPVDPGPVDPGPVDPEPEEPRTLAASFQLDTVEQGEQQTLSASGFDPGEMVSATIHSTPIVLTAQAADADGVVSWTFTVPSDFEVGSHEGVATSTAQGDQVSAMFQVTAVDTTGPAGGSLPETGSDAGNLATLSLLLLGAGAIVILTRRRSLS